jgi:hypothetical protein
MEQSPSSELVVPHVRNKIPTRNLNVHYRVHNSPPLVPALSHRNLFHTLPQLFFNIHYSIILPSTPRSSKWSVSFVFTHQYFECISVLPNTCYMPFPSHRHSYDHLDNICWTAQSWSSSLCSFLQSLITSCISDPNISLSPYYRITLFSKTLSLYPSLKMRDHVLHPYTATGKAVIMYSLVLTF